MAAWAPAAATAPSALATASWSGSGSRLAIRSPACTGLPSSTLISVTRPPVRKAKFTSRMSTLPNRVGCSAPPWLRQAQVPPVMAKTAAATMKMRGLGVMGSVSENEQRCVSADLLLISLDFPTSKLFPLQHSHHSCSGDANGQGLAHEGDSKKSDLLWSIVGAKSVQEASEPLQGSPHKAFKHQRKSLSGGLLLPSD